MNPQFVPEQYALEVSKRNRMMLFVMFDTFGMVACALGYFLLTATDEPIILGVCCIGLGVLMMLGGAWTFLDRRGYQHFKADTQGIYIPSEMPQSSNAQWLHVPWEKVHGISVAQNADAVECVQLELEISEPETQQFYKDIIAASRLLGKDAYKNGRISALYSVNMKNAHDEVATLQAMKEKYGSPFFQSFT